MHSHSHAPWIYQLESLDLPTWILSVQSPRSCTNQLLHKPTFLPTSFYYANHLLHQPTLTETTFTPTSFTQTNTQTHPLLHKPPFTAPTSFYKPAFTHILFLHKPAFTQTTFYTNQLLQPSFCTHHFLDKQTFYIQQPALHNPCFGPGGMLQAVKKNQLTQ